jgi:hypothetical protein
VEENEMSNNASIDRCQRLRELRVRIFQELQELKESVQREEHSGIDAPIETLSIIKSLQNVLNNIDVELKKCSG